MFATSPPHHYENEEEFSGTTNTDKNETPKKTIALSQEVDVGVDLATKLSDHDENEEEMLRRAIAMSLEGELLFGTGLILKDDIV